MLMPGLASPGPLAYDQMNAPDRYGRQLITATARARSLPVFGTGQPPARVRGRTRAAEVLYPGSRRLSDAMAQGKGLATPGPAYALPSTFVPIARPKSRPAQIQTHALRCNLANEADRERRSRIEARHRRAALAENVRQPLLGMERPRTRPATAGVCRSYSVYAARPDERPCGHDPRAFAVRRGTAHVRPRPQSARVGHRTSTPGDVTWTHPRIRGYSGKGAAVWSAGKSSRPLRSAFVQESGVFNRAGR